ncbi:50S ribosomal protein L11 methyltransferase [Roseobacter sp. HKCCD9010]|uniref:50S ribosomal protein L11 methyltransferase n=1 Tax=unclassified Roseobacter TaxID=196798 RepID=UPI001491427A|nr:MULTISPECIES: 50S ribosomal protein L11 methyltransferase [unclassified Roseobacter]MBF9049110.1 50S ribosomal protein L11 methyltransferase [Rhodobacterales bacterium HKCCD4356]NNV11110.1 50S ribosomal protein L11 methyltransferase [Roseobacter sp. HKCCD7357]NNV15294.1 50S ribosomal protein L11 methyltransferase [Roseobacter sp. HKCCD8768]NNV24754.1 50S ribosomal protein L11 methyltransferase [Roseobacter sp. HKCCD8192]NNV29010.1 50S ribosomal protein L11 methyltransferase [Roseobacter sp.
MPTYTALTTLPRKEAAEALGEALEGLEPNPTGVGVFEMEDGSGLWEVGGYFEAPPDGVALALLAAAHGAKDFAVSELPETDWVAEVRRELHPVTAGRFFVYGSHDADKLPDDAVGLLIEAAMAFGTGHHGTTQGCLEALDALISEGFVAHNTVDIGCGTAVLALAAAKTWPEIVLASDIDQVAVDVARANAAANGLTDRVICVEAAGFEHRELSEKAPFDLIFANILKGPLIDLAPAMAQHSAKGGRVILSGLLIAQADDVIAAYVEAGFSLIRRAELGDWATLTLGH